MRRHPTASISHACEALRTPGASGPSSPSGHASRWALALLLSAVLAAGGSPALAQKAGEPVTLNFVNAEIDAVARTMATIAKRSIVVDPRVKGTINLSTDKPVPPAEAWNQFLATLRLSGFTVVDSAGLLRVVPEADAKLQGGPVQIDGTPPAANQIVTQIFRLQHESPNSLVPLLRPLISPNNTINVNPGSNALVITDYADNLQRIARIIAALDVANATDLEVLPLKHAIASDLAPLVSRLVDGGVVGFAAAAPGQAPDTSFRTQIVAEPRSNALLVRAANAARLNLVKSLVDKLDQPSAQQASGNIHVVYLKNADAVKLATTLRAAMAGSAASASTAGGPLNLPAPTATAQLAMATSPATTPTQPSAQPSTGGQIQADPSTNSLIITASEPQYRQIRAVIDRLDQRRAQVFVESLIAEVNADRAAEFGVQWQAALGNRGDSSIGVLGTNFSIGGQNIISLSAQGAGGTVRPSTGLNIGVAQNTLGVYVLGALARFIESNGAGNILSTPNLLTLDNEEAKIVIGQNVPFVTGQFTNAAVGAGGAVNPFQTIERKDVGLTLRVKPQISENGTVKLQIYQEVSSVQASSVNSPTGLITNKRSIESNVLVDDGGVVVLGGLLQDEFSGNQEKLPGLGDIPLLGNLFRAETRSRKKTNLMVFLRPVVVRDAQQTEALSMDRYEMMRSRQESARPTPNPVLPIEGAPSLPKLDPSAPRRGAAPTSPATPTTPAAPTVR